MSAIQNFGNTLTGTVSPEDAARIRSGVTGPQAGAYNINGLDTTNQTLGNLSTQVGNTQNPTDNTQVQQQSALPGVGDYTGANAGQMGQQNALQQYLQSIAMGHGSTAADQMLQNAQVQAARGQQSNLASMGGVNPALGMRGMLGAQAGIQGNLAGQSAQQKLQEQENFGQMAGGLSQAITGQNTRDIGAGIQDQQRNFQADQAQKQQIFQQQQQQFMNHQQQFLDTMTRTQAQADIANNIFSNNARQTAYSTQLDQNRTAYSAMIAGQQLQAKQDQARSTAGTIKMGAGAVTAAAGGVLTATGYGSAIGAPMLAAGIGMMGSGMADKTAGPSAMDPALLAAMSRGGGGGGGGGGNPGYVDPYANNDGSMAGSGTGTVGNG